MVSIKIFLSIFYNILMFVLGVPMPLLDYTYGVFCVLLLFFLPIIIYKYLLLTSVFFLNFTSLRLDRKVNFLKKLPIFLLPLHANKSDSHANLVIMIFFSNFVRGERVCLAGYFSRALKK